MKTVIRKAPPDEETLYSQGIFTKEEELILFSVSEFSKWQEDFKNCLKEALEIVEESEKNKSRHGPRVDTQRIVNWIRKSRASLAIMENRKQEKKISSFIEILEKKSH